MTKVLVSNLGVSCGSLDAIHSVCKAAQVMRSGQLCLLKRWLLFDSPNAKVFLNLSFLLGVIGELPTTD